MSRETLPADERRDQILKVPLRRSEVAAIKAAASAAGLSTAAWIRSHALAPLDLPPKRRQKMRKRDAG